MSYNNNTANILGNCVTVARQTLTLFVGVRIPIPQPVMPGAEHAPGFYFLSGLTRQSRNLFITVISVSICVLRFFAKQYL